MTAPTPEPQPLSGQELAMLKFFATSAQMRVDQAMLRDMVGRLLTEHEACRLVRPSEQPPEQRLPSDEVLATLLMEQTDRCKCCPTIDREAAEHIVHVIREALNV